MRALMDKVEKVAATPARVLITGENGTGKELVARALHRQSPRASKPFVEVNCAAIPGELIESELFGHMKGSFTGAVADRSGKFEQANKGTLFLDEIGELELSLQAKLLRVLEEGSFRRVGGLKDLPLDVRVIAASNRDLRSEGEAGRFRSDLFYRLSVIQIDIPPLRERGEDVELLAQHYLVSFKERLRKNIDSISEEASEAFRNYEWPGNVRELRNVIERAMILEDGDEISAKYLPRALSDDGQSQLSSSIDGSVQSTHFRLPAKGVALEDVELSLVSQAIERSAGNQTKAAELLGISRDQLRYRLKKLDELKAQAKA